jgi:murein DD-endopeptidase MepM/ murein hydrolase activator NlpD
MPTWIKETNQAIYLMEDDYYLDKIDKQSRPEGAGKPGEKVAYLDRMQTWFNRSDAEIPKAMVITVGTDTEEPSPKPGSEPVLTLLQKPDAVAAGEAFRIVGQVPKTLAGKPVLVYLDVNGAFVLQTTETSPHTVVADDGSFQLGLRFAHPGLRRLKIVVEPLSILAEITITAVFKILQIPGEILLGEPFILSGSAPLGTAGEMVRLFVDNQAQPSQSRVGADGNWQIRFGLFGAGKREIKVAIGSDSETRTVRVMLKPLFGEFRVPETQLSSPNYPKLNSPVLGNITFTGGFMEPHGHSRKPVSYAIFTSQPKAIQTLPSSNRNYGIDYVVANSGLPIFNWYPGRVTKVGNEGGYGLRCHIDFFIFFELLGQRYPVKGAYAHGKSFSVTQGQFVKQGEAIGVMGNTGGNYPLHIDFRLWIDYQGRVIDLSPNLVEAQLRAQEQK